MNTTHKINNDKLIFKTLVELISQSSRYKNPSYRVLVNYLNNKGVKTSRGNTWTRKSLFRYLQRNGFSGVWGLRNSLEQYTKLAKFI
ncbi:recombinase family protein [Pseudoalteromonas sp. APM04]|nr:recombinase family protein [Pseudoalteromonas sp. APM04]UOB72478.1 recombinase family protein [Pseudoalteromonas sp. APM04]